TSSLGGAILVGDGTASNQARLTVDRTAFVNNTAATGGAIYNHNYSTATVEQSVFTDNHATTKSGALHSNNVFGSLTLAYLTLAHNSTGGTGPNIGSTGITHNLGYNLVDDINGAAHIFDSRKGDHVGNADFVVTGISDRLDPTDDTRTLRESIQDANSADGTIWLPAWRSVLTRRGFDDTALSGDLDVLGDISIVGAGAGLSMVDAMGSNGLGDRVFEVRPTGSLSIRGLTVSGGYTTSLGGAVLVGNGTPQNQAVLTVDRSSFEGNRADVGGAIYNHNYSTADVRRSAFTSNHAVSKSGALHSNNIAGSLTFEALTLAQNTTNAEGPNIASTGVTHNLGNNLVDDVQGAAHIFDMAKGDHVGSVDFVVTNLADRDALFDGGLSLREAVRASNAASVGPKLPGIPGFAGLTNDEGVESLLGEGRPSGGGRVDSARTIWLPAWEHRLTLQGFDAFALAGDLDILGDVTLVGTGPGFSVVDAGGADGLNDRVFEVRPQGHLALSRMTVAGGSTTSVGGGVLVGNGGSGNRATFLATETSFVDNVATNGGGIYNHNRSNTDVRRSVFTRNQATSTSGAIHSNNLPGLGQIVFEGLVLAQNTASIGPNVGSNTAAFVNLGNNLVDITTGAGSLFVGDTIGTANYVVNSVADTFDPASGTRARSLREAVDLANDSGSDSSIWLAPWLFRLNRQGTGGESEGAIDVLGSSDLTIQGLDLGASNAQTTLDATDLLDSVFDDIGTGDLFVLDVELIEP
ncbi:MAG: CSLREA domain-containing protein, partial [Planctomycetota bacterium]